MSALFPDLGERAQGTTVRKRLEYLLDLAVEGLLASSQKVTLNLGSRQVCRTEQKPARAQLQAEWQMLVNV